MYYRRRWLAGAQISLGLGRCIYLFTQVMSVRWQINKNGKHGCAAFRARRWFHQKWLQCKYNAAIKLLPNPAQSIQASLDIVAFRVYDGKGTENPVKTTRWIWCLFLVELVQLQKQRKHNNNTVDKIYSRNSIWIMCMFSRFRMENSRPPWDWWPASSGWSWTTLRSTRYPRRWENY